MILVMVQVVHIIAVCVLSMMRMAMLIVIFDGDGNGETTMVSDALDASGDTTECVTTAYIGDHAQVIIDGDHGDVVGESS